MMNKHSFRNPTTNVLTGYGYTDSNNDDIVQEEPEDFSLEPGKWKLEEGQWVRYVGDEKARKLADINAECDRRINAAVSSYPETEKLTFAKQESEARAFIANNNAPTPMIDALAANRGIAKADLANRIVGKADFFTAYAGAVIGFRQKLEDQVNAPDANLDLIDPLSGWPA